MRGAESGRSQSEGAMTNFSDLNLDPKVLSAIESAGYKDPTPIQAQAIPPAIAGRDVLGIAQTGTGKTASFTLPMITILGRGRARARMPRSLVLAPTRELATQVAENFTTYSANTRLSMALLIGGVSFQEQFALIDRGVDVLIATPGRLLDHFERGRLLLSGVQIMVVDEADRMLDMGFIPDIERIFKLTPFTRQTLFFSATIAPEIEKLTREFLSNPVRVEVTPSATVSGAIEQRAIMVRPSGRSAEFKDKRSVLRDVIRDLGDDIKNAIIFCNRKTDVDILQKSMAKHGFACAAIHGDLDQQVRTRVMGQFKEGSIRFLVASDVAARGLDIPDVSHIFNFDVPVHSEDYVHRIGRTGRAGRAGNAVTLCLPKEGRQLAAIEELIGREIPNEDREANCAREKAPKRKNRPSKEAKAAKRPEKPKPAAKEKPKPAQSQPPEAASDSSNVIGMGDHVPAFMLSDFGKRATA